MGEEDTCRSPLEKILTTLPAPLRGFFQKAVEGVSGALQVTLTDTLVGEFHEKFTAMCNNPGDRDAARVLRQCDRTHRETATKVVGEVLTSQLHLLAKTVSEALLKGGTSEETLSGDAITIMESKVTRMEEQLAEIERMTE